MGFFNKKKQKELVQQGTVIDFANVKPIRRGFLSAFKDAGNLRKPGGLNTNSFIPFSRAQYDSCSVLEQLNTMLQYPDYVSYLDFQYMYSRVSVANRVCTTYPKFCWNPRPVILEEGNTSGKPETPFEIACAEIAAKIDLYGQLQRVDECAQIGQYAVLYISFNDANKNKAAPDSARPAYTKDFKNPATNESYQQEPLYLSGMDQVDWESLKGKGADAINYVVPYQQPSAWPTQYVVDYDEPSFSLISYYNLQSGGQVFGGNGTSNNIVYGAALPVTWNVVHSSRCIHVVERNPNNNILGIPALQPIFNDLLNAIRVGGGSAMVYQNNARGGLAISIKGDETQSISPDDIAAFSAQVEDYLSNYKRALVNDSMDVKPIEFTVAAPDKHMGVYLQNISAGCGIPLRILLGNEAGRLASDQDKINFDSQVQARKDGYCTKIIRQFFDPLIAHEVIPAPKTGAYKPFFPNLNISDDSTIAQNFNQITMGLASLAGSPSTEIEAALPGFVAKAEEILKVVKDENITYKEKDLSETFLRPDLRVDDMEEVMGKDGYEKIGSI